MRIKPIIMFFALIYFGEVFAGAQTSITVTAQVDKFCSAESTPFTFIDDNNELIAQASVTVTCTAGTVFFLSINQDNAILKNTSDDTIKYLVYLDANRSQNLGNGLHQNTISGVGTGKPQTINLYAVIKNSFLQDKGVYKGNLSINLSF